MTSLVAAALTSPLVTGAALAALLLLVLAYESAGAIVTVAHEGGHVLASAVTGNRIRHFEVTMGGEGATWHADPGWGPSRILIRVAGYTTPPLLGLGGAALLATGRAWPLLWTAVVLLSLAFIKAEKEWTTFLVLLSGVFIGYVALYGTPMLQAGFAAGLVWLLLFGGAIAAVRSSTADGTDAANLAHDTFIPRIVWKAAFVGVALYCLWKGFLLLAP